MSNAQKALSQDTSRMPERLHNYLKNELEMVEGMLSRIDSDVPVLMNVMMHHVVAAGGKRTRPLLTLAIARLFGEIKPVTYSLAASIELIHTATLLHDDVMDDADLRRHSATAHTRFGNVMSILFGDFLLSMSFQHMLVKNDVKSIQIVAKACSSMTRGEIRQLTTRHQWQLSQEVYEQTISEKTAALFSASCQLGGLSQDVPDSVLDQLGQLGEHIGMAFQIIDDIMDYSCTNAGKNSGSDFFDGKITLPVILAVKKNIDSQFWRTVLTQEERDQTDFATAVACLQSHGILQECRHMAFDHIHKALEILDSIQADAVAKLYLRDFIESTGDRLQ